MEQTNGVPSNQNVGIPFDVGREVIRSHLRQEHLNRLQTCKNSHQSMTLINESLSRRTKELQATSKPEAYSSCGAVNRLNNPFRAQMFKLGLTQRKDCQLCWDEREDKCTYCMSLCSTGMQKIQKLGLCVLDTQGSRKHEGEWPNKSVSQYQAWRNTLTPF
jgi:hypothetical protein